MSEERGRHGALAVRLRSHTAYPVLYMFAVTLVFSSILIVLSGLSRERIEANRQIMFERAVLMALSTGIGPETPSREVHEVFLKRIAEPSDSSGGAYVLMDEGQAVGYAVVLSGQGFWDTIKGVIGIKPDRETLTGIAFYQQNETPGLGAEITKEGFRAQFKGKRLAASGKPIALRAVGSELDEHEVHAITGATQTCSRLEAIINEGVLRWQRRMLKGQERR